MSVIPFVEKHFHRLQTHSTIYDIGIGMGRNAIFLADKNFKIIGIDYNSEILETISHKNISTICTDINWFLSENRVFENVLVNFSLRFTGCENFWKNLEKIQKFTKIGGINIISDFIDDGSEFVKKWEWKDFYWLQKGELKNFYKNNNWEIIDYYEEKTKTKILNLKWEPLFCEAAYIIAKKIQN